MKLLLVIDMQNDFVHGALGTTEAINIVPQIVQKLEHSTRAKQDIMFTMDTHQENYLSTQEGQKLPVMHCIKPQKGWEIIPTLQPYVKTAKVVIEKPTFGATALADYVKEYDEIELIGLCTDICVISNALLLKAFYPEKKIIVDANCCAGVTPESHRNALAAMKMCQIEILENSVNR